MRYNRVAVWTFGAMMGVNMASAAIIVSDTWTLSEGWTGEKEGGGASYGTLTDPDANLDGTGVSGLKITRDSGAGVERDYISTSGNLAGGQGDWTTMGVTGVKSVRFDFYANAGGAVDYPAGLRLYFQAASGNIWYYTLDVTTLSSGWGEYGANIDPSLWWTEGAGVFATDLATVDEVGIWLSYQPGYVGQVFGLDDFALDSEYLPIPEPGTYAVLGVALLSLAMSFRQKLGESMNRALVQLRIG